MTNIPTQDEWRTCGVETDFALIDPELRDEVQRARDFIDTPRTRDMHWDFDRLAQLVRQIEKRVHSAPESVAECPFEGYVEVHTEPGGVAVWECPVCEHEHREEPE